MQQRSRVCHWKGIWGHPRDLTELVNPRNATLGNATGSLGSVIQLIQSHNHCLNDR